MQYPQPIEIEHLDICSLNENGLSKLQTMNLSVEFKRSSQADGWEFWFNVDKVDMSWCKNITTRQLTENMFIFGSKNLILWKSFYMNMFWKLLLITLIVKKIQSKYGKPRISLNQSFVCWQYCTQANNYGKEIFFVDIFGYIVLLNIFPQIVG